MVALEELSYSSRLGISNVVSFNANVMTRPYVHTNCASPSTTTNGWLLKEIRNQSLKYLSLISEKVAQKQKAGIFFFEEDPSDPSEEFSS